MSQERSRKVRRTENQTEACVVEPAPLRLQALLECLPFRLRVRIIQDYWNWSLPRIRHGDGNPRTPRRIVECLSSGLALHSPAGFFGSGCLSSLLGSLRFEKESGKKKQDPSFRSSEEGSYRALKIPPSSFIRLVYGYFSQDPFRYPFVLVHTIQLNLHRYSNTFLETLAPFPGLSGFSSSQQQATFDIMSWVPLKGLSEVEILFDDGQDAVELLQLFAPSRPPVWVEKLRLRLISLQKSIPLSFFLQPFVGVKEVCVQVEIRPDEDGEFCLLELDGLETIETLVLKYVDCSLQLWTLGKKIKPLLPGVSCPALRCLSLCSFVQLDRFLASAKERLQSLTLPITGESSNKWDLQRRLAVCQCVNLTQATFRGTLFDAADLCQECSRLQRLSMYLECIEMEEHELQKIPNDARLPSLARLQLLISGVREFTVKSVGWYVSSLLSLFPNLRHLEVHSPVDPPSSHEISSSGVSPLVFLESLSLPQTLEFFSLQLPFDSFPHASILPHFPVFDDTAESRLPLVISEIAPLLVELRLRNPGHPLAIGQSLIRQQDAPLPHLRYLEIIGWQPLVDFHFYVIRDWEQKLQEELLRALSKTGTIMQTVDCLMHWLELQGSCLRLEIECMQRILQRTEDLHSVSSFPQSICSSLSLLHEGLRNAVKQPWVNHLKRVRITFEDYDFEHRFFAPVVV